MRIYEVTVEIERASRASYVAWLRAHVAEILALPGFTGAEIDEVLEPASETHATFCVRYRLVDAAALEAYLRDHAPRLRADGLARFGERMRATRRVLAPLQG